MKSKKETFQINVVVFDKEGRRRIKWEKVQGERIDDETAIRREPGKGWTIWDIKTGRILCTKRAKSKADAVAYYEVKCKTTVEIYRTTTSYAKTVEDSIKLFNDPDCELKEEKENENENTAEEATGSNKKEEKQEEAKTETVEVPQVKALPAPKKEETDTTTATETVSKASDTVTASPATERQAKYLAALAKKLHNRQIIDISINYSSIDKETASRLIDESLKAIERGRRGNKKVPASYLLNSFRAAA